LEKIGKEWEGLMAEVREKEGRRIEEIEGVKKKGKCE